MYVDLEMSDPDINRVRAWLRFHGLVLAGADGWVKPYSTMRGLIDFQNGLWVGVIYESALPVGAASER